MRTAGGRREGETHVDKIVLVHDALDQRPALTALGVEPSPLLADRKGLVLPGDERDGLNDCRLNDLLAREDAPGNGVGPLGLRVGPEILKGA